MPSSKVAKVAEPEVVVEPKIVDPVAEAERAFRESEAERKQAETAFNVAADTLNEATRRNQAAGLAVTRAVRAAAERRAGE